MPLHIVASASKVSGLLQLPTKKQP